MRIGVSGSAHALSRDRRRESHRGARVRRKRICERLFPDQPHVALLRQSRRGARLSPLHARSDVEPLPANAASPQTLPLLVCGSGLYDPQAPGWFRTRYKDQLPKDSHTGSPTVNVLQAGLIKVRPDSAKPTPYMIANHMIAAGVTGECTERSADKIPNIQKYQAQDLVAATFLGLCADMLPGRDKRSIRRRRESAACLQWFGAPDGPESVRLQPFGPQRRERSICALALRWICGLRRARRKP